MIEKIKAILSSVRFWQIVGAGVIVWLESGDWKKGLLVILTASVGVGTIDKFIKR